MNRDTSVALGAVAGLVGFVGLWSLYRRYTAATVPHTVVARVGDVELRRYPPTVLAETVADDEREAFRRLFGYVSGAYETDDAGLRMTVPVEVSEATRHVPTTAPGGSDETDGGVRMAFHLPAEHDPESAPRPTDDDVTLVAVPERTLAVRRFSGRATDERVARETGRLREALASASVPLAGDPFRMRYDPPWTLPFLRRNEVAVEVESTPAG